MGAASDWIFNYLVVQITPVSIANIRWKTYMIFFVLNLLFAVTVYLFYPETTGRTLEEIDTLFFGENNRVIVVDKRGRLLPGFQKVIHSHEEGIATPASSDGEEHGKIQTIGNEKV